MRWHINFWSLCFIPLASAVFIVMSLAVTSLAEDQPPTFVDIGVMDLGPLKSEITRGLSTLSSTMKKSVAELLRSADTHYYLGKYEIDAAVAESHFETAVTLAESVLETEPTNPSALLAWCASKGEIAQHANPFRALGLIRPIEEKFLLLKTLAPQHEGFVADRALGRLYQLAPSFISIGSSKKARAHFQAALSGAPEHPGNQVYWAEFLLDDGDKAEARLFALKTLSNPKLLPSSLERFDWVARAKVILEKTEPERR